MEIAEEEAGMNGQDSSREGMEVTRKMKETKIDFKRMEKGSSGMELSKVGWHGLEERQKL